MKRFPLLCSLACLSLPLVAGAAAPADLLETGFQRPPDSAKPQTWWHWMNGNITREGITADLEAMKWIGLGGATIVNVDSGIPRGAVSFLTPEWRGDFKFAVEEAHRLGLDLTVENCAGWSSSGGPWNTPEDSMQHVVSSETRVSGPHSGALRVPQPAGKLGVYHDIAVLAFPVPADGGPSMKEAVPTVSVNGGPAPGDLLADGNTATVVRLPAPAPGKPPFVQLEFPTPFSARRAKIIGGPDMPGCRGEILVSDDGTTFRPVKTFTMGRRTSAGRNLTLALGSQRVTARFWRVQFNSITASDTATEIPLAKIELTPRLGIESFEAKAGLSGNAVLSSVETNEPVEGVIPLRGVVDLTAKLTPEGTLNWDAPPGEWEVLRFGYTPTGAINHPAPQEGQGLECDKMSKTALDHHWAGFMQKVLDDAGPLAGKTLTTSLIDSYEVGGQNWTARFPEEFQQRRGYDLRPYLPVFTDRVVGTPAMTERFLWDVRRTIADLFAENYFHHFAELCRQHGLASAIEPYTGPFEAMQSGAPADVVMGEFWSGSAGHPSVKLVSSIAHAYGKTIVGAESFTAAPAAGKWQNDPYQLKALGDLMFCQGLNRYIFHRYAMQPWNNRWPGMTMGQWGFHFERTNTWWHQGKPWIDYISRCEFLLQQGRAVADAAYYNGESAPVDLRVNAASLPAGHDYDALNADVLLRGATVKDGRLTMASGASYALLILPEKDTDMTPGFLARLAELVRAGLTVVGPRPQRSPSLAGYPGCDAQVQKLADELWGPCDGKTVQEHACGQGRVLWGKSLADVFAAQKLSPQFEYTGTSPDTKLAWNQRTASDAEIFFVSNQRQADDSAEATFRVHGKTPELWYPETGVIERAPVWREQDGRTTVRLKFEPAGSVFVVFRAAAESTDHVVSAKEDAQWQSSVGPGGDLIVKAVAAGVAEYRTAAGKTLRATATDLPAALELSGPWDLSFPPNWGAPPEVKLDKLLSWPDHPESGVKYFSGTATYKKEIDVPADRLGAGRELWLDLGAVKNFAEVSLNGQPLGVLWKPPFRANLTGVARPGANHLEVKVTNLWPNRLIGDEQLPPDMEWNGLQLKGWPQWLLDGKASPTGRLTFTTWHHWKKDSPLLESGLLGPVTLRTTQVVPAN